MSHYSNITSQENIQQFIPYVEDSQATDAARLVIEQLRMNLLDISNRNKLVNMKHSDKSKNHVRVIDELPDQLLERLEADRKLTFKALPPPPDVPEDEQTDQFLMALEEARQTDQTYLEAIEKLEEDSPNSKRAQQIERALKDRVREQLGLGKRPHTDVMSIGEYARLHGFEPSFDLPTPTPGERLKRHNDNEIQTLMLPEAMQRSLSGVLEQAKSALREMGTNTLFVAFGFLEWYESQDSNRALYAPLLLHPVEMTKVLISGEYRYTINSTGEETEVNLTISERLARDFNLRLPEYEEGDTPERYFEKVREHFANKQPRWKVRRFVTVGHFSFSRLVMFRDLDPANWPEGREMHKHAGVAALLGGTNVETNTSAEPYSVDDPQIASKVPLLISDADSSQFSAIVDVMEEKNLAIEGPPGTGKSQTITNLIGAGLAKGKRVLFIAEKMAALQVVKSRLDAAGIGEFILELHSTKARKTDVLQSLRERLEIQDREREPERLDEARRQLNEYKDQLTRYVDLLNRRHGKLGVTIQQILWAEKRIKDEADLPSTITNTVIENADEITPYSMEEAKGFFHVIENHVNDFVRTYHSIAQHPWHGIWHPDISPFERDSLILTFSEWRKAAQILGDSLVQVPGLGLTRADACRLLAARNNFPEEIGLPEVFAQLNTNERLSAVEALLDELDRWEEGRKAILTHCKDPESLARRQGDLAEIEAEARRLKLEGYSLGGLPGLADQERAKAENWLNLKELADQLLAAADLEGPATARSLQPLIRAARLLASIDRRLLLLRTQQLIDERSAEDLERGRRKRDELAKRKGTIEQNMRVPITDESASNEMRLHATALRRKGLFSGFTSDVRRAKRYYRDLQVRRGSTSREQMAKRLEDAAQLVDEIQNVQADTMLKEICGSRFNGLETDFETLIQVNEFASSVKQDIAGLDRESRTVRKMLLKGEMEELNDLIGIAQDPLFPNLEQAMTELPINENAELIELAQRCETRADEIEAIKNKADDLALSEVTETNMLPTILEQTQRLATARQSVEDNTEALKLLDIAEQRDMADPTADRTALATAVRSAQMVHSLDLPNGTRAHLFAPDYTERRDALIEQSDDVEQALEKFDQARSRAVDVGQLDVQAFLQEDPELTQMEDVVSRIERAEGNPGSLQSWSTYISALFRARETGLQPVLDAFNHACRTYKNLDVAYEYALYRSLARSAYAAHPELTRFSGMSQEEARERFRQTDRDIIKMERRALRAQLSRSSITHGNAEGLVKEKTELGLIKHVLQLKRPRTPLRDLLDRSGQAIQEMKPCFMMSPLSVAQYLKPGRCEFDLVVIDEASQMKPEEAIGGLVRSGQIVVVGDPKQLPPTSFFDRVGASARDEDEEDTEAASVESILEMAMHCWQPYRRLLWHYRSRHSSLIAFSNEQFYNRDLIVFPAPVKNNPEYGVHMEKVNGQCRRGGTNTIEAQRIAEAAVDFMRLEAEKNEKQMRSLGVVAMNRSQTELILDEINRLLQRTPDAYAYTEALENRSGGLENFFVKNLENVQGDERDVIYISATYGPDPDSGVVHQRFGPINTDLGYRRLNVLFTRAKQQIRLFTSMKAADIKVSDPNVKRGRRAFHDYLEYAATGRLYGGTRTCSEPTNDFERFVKNRLEARGFDVDCQIGVAGYFLDLAVSHPSFPDGYIAGVECDGATYHSAFSARDRDRLRQEVLENLGWNIYRVWSTDWFSDPDYETQRMDRYLRDLLRRVAPSREKQEGKKVVSLFR